MLLVQSKPSRIIFRYTDLERSFLLPPPLLKIINQEKVTMFYVLRGHSLDSRHNIGFIKKTSVLFTVRFYSFFEIAIKLLLSYCLEMALL